MTPPTMPFILGIAGGIGAGKSTVARALLAMGALVIDADHDAKAALDRPDIRTELTSWWGPHILSPAGTIDRAKIAAIVFADESQRKRLEALIHPIVKATRAEYLARGRAANTELIVIDAPLLFEAGLDRECDAVLFVDASKAARLERVQRTRGWDEAELDRRESVQMPLADKRARASAIIQNEGPQSAVAAAVTAAVRSLRASHTANPSLARPPTLPPALPTQQESTTPETIDQPRTAPPPHA